MGGLSKTQRLGLCLFRRNRIGQRMPDERNETCNQAKQDIIIPKSNIFILLMRNLKYEIKGRIIQSQKLVITNWDLGLQVSHISLGYLFPIMCWQSWFNKWEICKLPLTDCYIYFLIPLTLFPNMKLG